MATQQAAATRKNTKTVAKFYDEMVINGCNLKFEYETENDVLIPKITVNGTKGTSSIFVSKDGNQVQTIFSNGEYDSEIVNAVIAEFAGIVVEHTPAAEK